MDYSNWIIALAAIIAPVITTFINNRHNQKLKRIEIEQENIKNSKLHIRQLAENFIESLYEVNEMYYSDDPEVLKKIESVLFRRYNLLAPYIPYENKKDFLYFVKMASNNPNLIGLLHSKKYTDTIIPVLKKLVQTENTNTK
ncbi:hypothetical protein ACF3NG_06965 [Aerococcaceae bacterium WGS1372]